jgi:membrane protease YdiL (CAAX protease family)
VSEPGVFWGLVSALFFALPVFAYGNFNGIPSLIVTGSLMVLVLSGGITTIATLREKNLIVPTETSVEEKVQN